MTVTTMDRINFICLLNETKVQIVYKQALNIPFDYSLSEKKKSMISSSPSLKEV
jgi:hypothetical protein